MKQVRLQKLTKISISQAAKTNRIACAKNPTLVFKAESLTDS